MANLLSAHRNTPTVEGGSMESDSKKETGQSGWLGAFICELLSMPRHHMLAFLVATVLLVFLEVELTDGWHLVHVAAIVGGMMFVYLIWTAWRSKA